MPDEYELLDMDIRRVDLVGRAATKQSFLLWKSLDEDLSKDDDEGEKSLDGDNPAEEGGTTMGDTELAVLKKAQDDIAALQKALGEKDGALLTATTQIAGLTAAVKDSARKGRVKELEPLCKSASMDMEKVLKAEERDLESAAYFEDIIAKQQTRIDELLRIEKGTERHDTEGDDNVLKAENLITDYMAKNKVDIAAATIAVMSAHPELQ